jgi:hypothetical protein
MIATSRLALIAAAPSLPRPALADLQACVDHRSGARVDLAPEGAAGRMVGPQVGVWSPGGEHVAGDWTGS